MPRARLKRPLTLTLSRASRFARLGEGDHDVPFLLSLTLSRASRFARLGEDRGEGCRGRGSNGPSP